MSRIFILGKARKPEDSEADLYHITRRDPYISGENAGTISVSDPDPLPYIAILADLGQPSMLSVTFPERAIRDLCLRIYAAGLDSTTHPFLEKYPELVKALDNLMHPQQILEAEFYMKYLNAQVEFGSTAKHEHMV